MEKTELLGVGITNATEKEILEYIIESLEKKGKKYYVVTPNPEILVYSVRHKSFKKILNDSSLSLCDGVGLMWGATVLGKPLIGRTTGVDLVKSLVKRSANRPITIGFLGGRDGVAEKTAECLGQKYPGISTVYAKSGNPDQKTVDEIKEKMGDKTIDILFVAFGFPKQEEFMNTYLDQLPVRVMVGVGGAFDYLSGKVPRAPFYIRKIGFEWLFRLIVQPWRIKRQLALLEFVWLVFREKIMGS